MNELEDHLGKIEFVIPTIVIRELNRIASLAGIKRSKEAKLALELANKFKIIELEGAAADDVITAYAVRHKCFAATIDSELKNKLRRNSVNVITLSNNRLKIV